MFALELEAATKRYGGRRRRRAASHRAGNRRGALLSLLAVDSCTSLSLGTIEIDGQVSDVGEAIGPSNGSERTGKRRTRASSPRSGVESAKQIQEDR